MRKKEIEKRVKVSNQKHITQHKNLPTQEPSHSLLVKQTEKSKNFIANCYRSI